MSVSCNFSRKVSDRFRGEKSRPLSAMVNTIGEERVGNNMQINCKLENVNFLSNSPIAPFYFDSSGRHLANMHLQSNYWIFP